MRGKTPAFRTKIVQPVRVKIWKRRHSDKIAVFHIKIISSILKKYDFPYENHLRVRSLGLHSCCHSSQFISRIFNQHRLLGKKRNDTWIYEDKKMQRTSKIAQNSGFIHAEACGLQDDVILLCLASSTIPRRPNLQVALAQYTVTHLRSSSSLRRGSL